MADEQFSVESARKASEEDALNEWVREFLTSEGSDNADLGQFLTDPPRQWLGPVQLPFSKLHRLAGPEGERVVVEVDEEDWGDGIDEMQEELDEGWEPPPLIVSIHEDQLVLEDGNHRVESMRRSGREQHWALVNFMSQEQRDRLPEPEEL